MGRFILFFVALFCFFLGKAEAVNQQTICLSDPVPAGWIVASREYNISTCNTPYAPVFNQGNLVTIYQYDNLPVGANLTVCYDTVAPPGWTINSTFLSATCKSIYGGAVPNPSAMSISHTSCVNQSASSCYPSQPATISATPTSVVVPYAQSSGSTSVSYSNPSGGTTCIWTQNTGGSVSLWHCGGNSGSNITWTYVPVGGSTNFYLSNSSTSSSPVIASVAVSGVAGAQPAFSVNPIKVKVPAGQTVGSTVVSWDTSQSGYSNSCIWIQNTGGAVQLWSCNGASGTLTWPYVPLGGSTTFFLTPGSTSATPVLATAVASSNVLGGG